MNYEELMQSRTGFSSGAMNQWPLARIHEFQIPLTWAELDNDQAVVDAPSGKGYLSPFLTKKINLINIDSIDNFMEAGRDGLRGCAVSSERFNTIDLRENSVDRFLSIAGLHHIKDRSHFHKEAFRVLRPDGIYVIAEVGKNTPPAEFLNSFVDRYAKTGHKGIFFSERECEVLEECGFDTVIYRHEKYPWIFDSEDDMVDFCKGLFCLDLATREDVYKGLEDFLGFTTVDDKVHLDWELSFFKSVA